MDFNNPIGLKTFSAGFGGKTQTQPNSTPVPTNIHPAAANSGGAITPLANTGIGQITGVSNNVVPSAGSMFSQYIPNNLETEEQKHQRYLADMAKKREVIKQQADAQIDPVKKANTMIQYKTSIVSDYFKDKAYQNGLDRYSVPDEQYVQQQMNNSKSFPTANIDITAYMQGTMDEKTLFRKLDKQFSQTTYVPKLATALREVGFEGKTDMDVINNYIEKSGDEKAKQDMIDLGILDSKQEKVIDALAHPGTKLQEYAAKIKNPIVAGLLSTVGQAMGAGEKLMGGATGLAEKVLPGEAPAFNQENAQKTTFQNVTDLALGAAETYLMGKFPGITTAFNIAAKTPGLKIVPEAIQGINEFIGGMIGEIPVINEILAQMTPEQHKEAESLMLMGTIEGIQRIRGKTPLSEKVGKIDAKTLRLPGSLYEKLAMEYPQLATAIESNILPVAKQVAILTKRLSNITKKQEGITSQVMQPVLKDVGAAKATTDVFKTEPRANIGFSNLLEQTKTALGEAGKRLEDLVGGKEKALTDKGLHVQTTVDPRITNIAELVKSKMETTDPTLANTPSYIESISRVKELANKAANKGLTNIEKQELKHLFDAEEANLYDPLGKIKGSDVEAKSWGAERQYLKGEIEKGSGLEDGGKAVELQNEKYSGLKKAVARLEKLSQDVANSKDVPNAIKEWASKFAVGSFLREYGVKGVARLDKEITAMVRKLEKYNKPKEVFQSKLDELIPKEPGQEVKSIPGLPNLGDIKGINTNIVGGKPIINTKIGNVRKGKIIEK